MNTQELKALAQEAIELSKFPRRRVRDGKTEQRYADFDCDKMSTLANAYLQQSEALDKAVEALRSVACTGRPNHELSTYWLELGIEETAEVCAEDTRCAREALAAIEKILGEK